MNRKQKFEEVKRLIQDKHYDKARTILLSINHPLAKQWLDKLEKIAPAGSRKNKPLPLPLYVSIFFAATIGIILAIITFTSQNQSPIVVPTVASLNSGESTPTQTNSGSTSLPSIESEINFVTATRPEGLVLEDENIASISVTPTILVSPAEIEINNTSTPTSTNTPTPTITPQPIRTIVERIYFINGNAYYSYDIQSQALELIGDFGNRTPSHAAISPNGQKLAWLDADDVYITDISTWETKNLSVSMNTGQSHDIIWYQDSQKFVLSEILLGSIYLINLETSDFTELLARNDASHIIIRTPLGFEGNTLVISYVNYSADLTSIDEQGIATIAIDGTGYIEQYILEKGVFGILSPDSQYILGACIEGTSCLLNRNGMCQGL